MRVSPLSGSVSVTSALLLDHKSSLSVSESDVAPAARGSSCGGVTASNEAAPAFKCQKTTLQEPPFYATINLFWAAKPTTPSVLGRFKPDLRRSFTVLAAMQSIAPIKSVKKFRNLAQRPNHPEPCGSRKPHPCGNIPPHCKNLVLGRFKPDLHRSFTVLAAIQSIAPIKSVKKFNNLAQRPNHSEPCGSRKPHPCGNIPNTPSFGYSKSTSLFPTVW